MVSKGSFMPVFTRPVAFILFAVIVYMVISQTPFFIRFMEKIKNNFEKKKTVK